MQRVCILCFIFCISSHPIQYRLQSSWKPFCCGSMADSLDKKVGNSFHTLLLFPIIFGPFPPSLSPSQSSAHRVGGTANALSWGTGGNSRSLGAPLCPLRFSCHIAPSLPEHHHSGPVLPSTITGPYLQSAPLRVGSPIDKVA